MLRGTDVARMMTRVETALSRAARAGRGGLVYVGPVDDGELGIARLRDEADIKTDFPSGSDRPVFGALIRVSKGVLRRGLRWYLQPMMEQQSSFNHSVLDLVERLRLENERLLSEIENLRRQQAANGLTEAPNGALPAAADDLPPDP